MSKLWNDTENMSNQAEIYINVKICISLALTSALMLLEFSMKNCSIACTPSIVVVSSWVLSSPSSKISLRVLFSYDATNSHLYLNKTIEVFAAVTWGNSMQLYPL
jgi:hypothetical protein